MKKTVQLEGGAPCGRSYTYTDGPEGGQKSSERKKAVNRVSYAGEKESSGFNVLKGKRVKLSEEEITCPNQGEDSGGSTPAFVQGKGLTC